jgi:hypothetical protein
MHEPTDGPTRSLRRVALRAALLVGGATVFLLLNPLAARADPGDGLVGAVTGAVDEVTETVDESVGEVAETVTDVVEETIPVVEDVLDTTVETVEEVVAVPVEAVERTVEGAIGAVDPAPPVVPGGRSAPPAADEEPARERHDGVTGGRAAHELRLALRDRPHPVAGSVALAADVPAPAPAPAAPVRGADPIDPARSAPVAPAAASGSLDRPFDPRIPHGQDLAVLAAALLVALTLVRTSRRDTGSPASPAFLSILERPG